MMAHDIRELRAYVTALDGQQYDNLPEGIVCLLITHSNLKLQMVDIRLDLHSTISELRHKVYQHTGTKPDAMDLLVMRNDGSIHARLDDDRRMLGFYGVENGMRLHVVDKDPFSLSKGGGLEDVSLVKKYEISEEDYDKQDPAAFPGPDSVANMKVGDRCEVQPGGRRGQVQYLGEISELAPGFWVGVQFDEPVGKSNGSVKGATYFKCEQNYGGFVRPHNVTVGDFPVLDPFADLSDNDEL
ncbi:hypothetical protein PsorP6_012947 [Peronosclerospora sorghi]|uniref:Uncharacterized protein n=1 Tax=Peronosclerospora sorghi TaxID=230839 RepID=A0ACC0WES0_9STRA|nr:hypothetical protein PsorP6_012947 [Peronosclerospora sorghi]